MAVWCRRAAPASTPCQVQTLSLKQTIFVHWLPLNSSFSSEPFKKTLRSPSLWSDDPHPHEATPPTSFSPSSAYLYRERVRFCITKCWVWILPLSQGDREFFCAHLLSAGQPDVCPGPPPHHERLPTTGTLRPDGLQCPSHIAFLEKISAAAWTVPLPGPFSIYTSESNKLSPKRELRTSNRHQPPNLF